MTACLASNGGLLAGGWNRGISVSHAHREDDESKQWKLIFS